MESTIVIKVKFGKTLRRFNARVSEARNLELSLDGLLEKVCSLFNLSPEADITVTYLDEDGDSVTLADEEDLKDAIMQSLNPLRITVKLNSDQGNIGSSAKVTQPLPDLSSTVSEIFKSVPEPFGEALSKLSHDLASKATASSPQLPELVQQFSKMLQSCEIPASDSQVAKESEAVPKSANPPFKYEKKVRSSKCLHPRMKEPGESSLKAGVTKPAWGSFKAGKDVMNSRWGSKLPGVGECPFSGSPVENVPPVPSAYFSPRMHPFKRSFSHGGVSGILHRGVQCDGCGVHPISGPRFKSKVKDDYDLCSICFAEMGSEADYNRLDRPVHRHSHLFKRLHNLNARLIPPLGPSPGMFPPPGPPPGVIPPPTMPPLFRSVGKQIRPKLDSRFIMDVYVADGTMMAPLTPFTKIWRMRNNGTLLWPQGTQVVWIGGDRLSALLSAGLQIPGEGLAVENELEIAVDFKAPELPGRYISYWRMATPSGQKFGQRIWVLIQVDASTKDSEHNDKFQGLSLNLPHESSGLNEAEIESNTNGVPLVVDAPLPINEPSRSATDHVAPLDAPLPTENQDVGNNLNEAETGSKGQDLVEPLDISLPTKNQDLDFPINDNLLVNGATVFEPSAPASGGDDVEQVLLMELEAMGFKQVDLNKEILRKNEYDLEQSVDDLCGVSEWDPILDELQEMGFCDDEMNKKLLKKNNGSIKGAVMDLISGEKP